MSTFDDQLLKIHQKIAIKDESRRPYTEMFETIKNWLIEEMCEVDPVFKEMCKGASLFGSYPNRVRIIKPSEFDVFIQLKFPFPINVRTHCDRPGFVRINTRRWKTYATDPYFRSIYGYMFIERRCLHRNRVQRWIEHIIEQVLRCRPRPKGYNIQYTRCNVAQNIYVQEKRRPHKSISIDFVPGIMVPRENVTLLINNAVKIKEAYLDSFVAIPKSLKGCGPRSSRTLTFQLVNPDAERDIIWDKQNLKVVYRLLKSLRNRYKLKRLKSYFLTAIFLWQIEKSDSIGFWQMSVGDILLEMGRRLCRYFKLRELPYYWVSGFNLLSILKPNEISKYGNILQRAYKCIEKISHKKSVSYSEVAVHFETTIKGKK